MFESSDEADAFVEAIAKDWRTAPLGDADRALCAFATKLTHAQHEMTPADLDSLREHGFDDTAIHDAVQTIGYFNYVSRVADALGVEDEEHVKDWNVG